MEALRAYLRQYLLANPVTGIEIEERSGGRITDGYVSDIVSGKTKRPSAEKLQALADGLGLDGAELYKIAVGYKQPPEDTSDPWPSARLLSAIEQIVHSRELTQIVQKLLTLDSTQLSEILSEIEKR